MTDQPNSVPPIKISPWLGQWLIVGGTGKDVVHIEYDADEPCELRIHYGPPPNDNHILNLVCFGSNQEYLSGDIQNVSNGIWASFVWVMGRDSDTEAKFVNGCWWNYEQAGSLNWDLVPFTATAVAVG
ncbi:MAG TPA: hypothetical protein VN937_16045 [Blastocatellia bacterium]|nr:hypothetical protein [Blastocatellia bacterium]